ncbi:heterokaryon incompatibility protein-domain-containing protein [Apiospora arundinis]|uniref:Heterokaryon incompatibility protein-domain-containing protein n=1 Tax=Apiospora arundinis TaxID=335852 RepID=A0ABR2I9L5_9PEZI
MMSDVEEHRHKPLGSPDLIRVLDLQPSRSPSAPIQCKLRQVPLDDSGTTFEALSYVWGARAGDQPILCDGQRLLVTPNCHGALVQLRRRFRKRTMWIDAICINQRDDEPHDKVYGFYAMIQRWGVELAPPDYEKDVSQLFQEFVVAFVQHNKSLEPLTTTLPAPLATGLASWTPNWLTAQTTIGDDRVDMNGVFDMGFFRNGQLASLSSKATVKWDPGHGSIELRSKRIGDIMTLSSCSPEEPREPEQFKEFVSECRNWCQANREEITSYNPYSINDLFALSSFCSTIDSSVWFHTMIYQNLNEAAAAILSPGLQPPQYLQELAKRFEGATSPELIQSTLQEYSSITQSLVNNTAHYAFIVLDTGHLGRAHHSCQLGDEIWLLAGCNWPLVLRRQGDSFRIVAPVYIVDMMRGELWPEDEDTLETITLV